MIDYVNCSHIDDLKKIKMIIGLKQIRYTVLLSMKRKIFGHKFSAINIMHKTNPKCCNEGSLMYSILISLHYDISYNPERITKLRAYTNEYDFTNTTQMGLR